VLHVLGSSLRVNKDVVKVGRNKVVKNVVEKVINIPLECRQSITEAKRSDKCFI
jgi:hypothetical protein